MTNQNKFTTVKLAKLGMMAAVACVLGFIKFPIFPMVPFLTYDFADIPIIISAFAFGPFPGILILSVVSAIQAFALGGDGIYGFIMHMIASGVFIIISSEIYKHNKTKKAAIISMVIGTLAMTVIMGIANYFITPFYLGSAMRTVIVELMPWILLFNLVKGVLNSAFTFVIYKRISPFLHKN